MPALSHYFGIKGADLEVMPQGEIRSYLNALKKIQQQKR